MERNNNISNGEELKQELARLKQNYTSKQTAIIEDGKGIVHAEIDKARSFMLEFKPGNLINTLLKPKHVAAADAKFNLAGMAVKSVVPFILNKTIFRGSGFLMKALVGYGTRTLGDKVNIGDLQSLLTHARGWVEEKIDDARGRRRKPRFEDYGIDVEKK